MSQPIMEYRGCVILVYPGLDPIRYGSPCTTYLRWTVDRVKKDIDATLEPEEPEEDYWAYHSTYRGVEIQKWIHLGSIVAYGAWIGGDWVARTSLSALKGLIDDWLGPVEPEPGTATINGIVDPAKAGFNVRLRHLRNGTWVTVGSKTTDAGGRVTFSADAPPWGETPYTYRLRMYPQTVDGVEYWVYNSGEAQVWAGSEVDLYLYPPPVDVAKKPTTLTIDVYPTTGTPPFDVIITAELTSNGSPVGYKNIKMYMRSPEAGIPNTLISTRATNASGVAEFSFHVGVSAPHEFYVYFAGDSEYEGCSSDGEAPPPGAAGGAGILIALWLVSEMM